MEKIRSAYNPLEKFAARRSPGFRLSKKLYALHEYSMFLPQFPFRRARARVPRFSFLKLTPGVIMLAGNGRVVRR